MKGELVFDLEKYSKQGLDVYDYDATIESTLLILPFTYTATYLLMQVFAITDHLAVTLLNSPSCVLQVSQGVPSTEEHA